MRTGLSHVAAALSGVFAVSLLAAAWQALGSLNASDPNYPVTNFFVGSIDFPFTGCYAMLSFALGAVWRQVWPVALGMIAPLPIAAGYECAIDATNHNLIPFEVAFLWVPAFLVALGPAALGARIRRVHQVPRDLKAGPGAGT